MGRQCEGWVVKAELKAFWVAPVWGLLDWRQGERLELNQKEL